MSILNSFVCAAAGGNTGIADCAISIGLLKSGFLVPNSFELTEAQLADSATALAALQAAAQNDDPAQRIYPLPDFLSVTDNTEDLVTEAIGGVPVPVRDGNYNLLIRYLNGGNCLSNALSKFNSGSYRFLGIDNKGILFGTKEGTSLKGVPLYYFYSRPFRFATDTTAINLSFQIVFEPIYLNSGLGFIQLNPADVLNISGLMNINLSLVGTRTAGVFVLQAKAGCAGVNLYDQYSADLADATIYEVLNKNGLVVPITSVAAAPASKGFTFTLDTASANYTSGQPYTVKGAGVSALVAADIDGYEIAPPIVVA